MKFFRLNALVLTTQRHFRTAVSNAVLETDICLGVEIKINNSAIN